MAHYMIAANRGPGEWEPLAYVSRPQQYQRAWADLRKEESFLQGFEQAGDVLGSWTVTEDNRLEQTESWTMIPQDKHDRLVKGQRP